MNRIVALTVVACALTLGAFVSAAKIPGTVNDPVRLDTGLVVGASGKSPGVRVFKGIPYAAPPVGDLRWREPQPPAQWNGVRKADRFSPTCMEALPKPGSFYQIEFFPEFEPMSEDCLCLNVWTAAKSARERRPVMVWIHGGAFLQGSGSMPSFDGETLARKGIVLVTINYRLGAFGFLAHPELTQESGHNASGNYGLLDQIAALKWVQRNIAAFGGDPKNVTLFGQSAGSMSVYSLMASPLAKGLFHRAIGQSGGFVGGAGARKLAEAEKAGEQFAQSAGASSLAALRAKSADELMKISGRFGVVVDGYLLPSDVYSLFASGKQNNVPVLVGSTAGEGGLNPGPKTAQEFIEQARRTYGDLADEFLKIFPANSDEQAKASAYAAAAARTAAGMRTWARLVAQSGKQNAYIYNFTRKPPGRDGERIGAFHSAELVYVFGTLNSTDRPWRAVDWKLSDVISSYWANFAAKGDPNSRGLPHWPSVREQRDAEMDLGDTVEARIAPRKAALDFFDKHFANSRTL